MTGATGNIALLGGGPGIRAVVVHVDEHESEIVIVLPEREHIDMDRVLRKGVVKLRPPSVCPHRDGL
jgi:hypothetical protein